MALRVGVVAADERLVSALADELLMHGLDVTARATIADNESQLTKHLIGWIADDAIDMVVTVSTDASRTVVAPLITKRLLGFSDLKDIDGGRCETTVVILVPRDTKMRIAVLDKVLPRIESEVTRKPSTVSIPATPAPTGKAGKKPPPPPPPTPGSAGSKPGIATIPPPPPAGKMGRKTPPPMPRSKTIQLEDADINAAPKRSKTIVLDDVSLEAATNLDRPPLPLPQTSSAISSEAAPPSAPRIPALGAASAPAIVVVPDETPHESPASAQPAKAEPSVVVKAEPSVVVKAEPSVVVKAEPSVVVKDEPERPPSPRKSKVAVVSSDRTPMVRSKSEPAIQVPAEPVVKNEPSVVVEDDASMLVAEPPTARAKPVSSKTPPGAFPALSGAKPAAAKPATPPAASSPAIAPPPAPPAKPASPPTKPAKADVPDSMSDAFDRVVASVTGVPDKAPASTTKPDASLAAGVLAAVTTTTTADSAAARTTDKPSTSETATAATAPSQPSAPAAKQDLFALDGTGTASSIDGLAPAYPVAPARKSNGLLFALLGLVVVGGAAAAFVLLGGKSEPNKQVAQNDKPVDKPVDEPIADPGSASETIDAGDDEDIEIEMGTDTTGTTGTGTSGTSGTGRTGAGTTNSATTGSTTGASTGTTGKTGTGSTGTGSTGTGTTGTGSTGAGTTGAGTTGTGTTGTGKTGTGTTGTGTAGTGTGKTGSGTTGTGKTGSGGTGTGTAGTTNVENVSTDGCDKVSCVIDNFARPCCEPFRPRKASEQPYELDKAMITTGMSKGKAAVIRCGEQHAQAKGIVKIAMTVSPVGAVTAATVAEAPEPALGECVANAVRKLSFAKTETGGTFTYPFKF